MEVRGNIILYPPSPLPSPASGRGGYIGFSSFVGSDNLIKNYTKNKRPWDLPPMAFVMQRQKSHGGHLAHPRLPVTMQVGSGAWVSPAKIKREEKEMSELHDTPLPSVVLNFLSYPSEMSREKLQGREMGIGIVTR
ncbi:MAG: hypothetical protein A2Y65_09850 [Deltaproteobacteria bacterium RBG_13_52_11]|nr:MAG: hypothetical protein A2Y65_09850 [Deltaproteobacteria bacterium RBG_13_52_11]